MTANQICTEIRCVDIKVKKTTQSDTAHRCLWLSERMPSYKEEGLALYDNPTDGGCPTLDPK